MNWAESQNLYGWSNLSDLLIETPLKKPFLLEKIGLAVRDELDK